MTTPDRPVFKMLSFRGTRDGLVVVPPDEIPDDPAVTGVDALGTSVLDASHRDIEVALRTAQAASAEALRETALSSIAVNVIGNRAFTAASLLADATISEFVRRDRLNHEYALVMRSWLRLRLLGDASATRDEHEQLLRVGSLLRRVRRDPGSLADPEVIRRMRSARVALPRRWRTPRPAATPQRESAPDRGRDVARAKREFGDTAARIRLRENLTRKIVETHTAWIDSRPRNEDDDARVRAGVPDARYFDMLDTRLSADERDELESARGPVARLAPIGITISDLAGSMNNDVLIDHANDLCSSIRIMEDDDTRRLPGGATATEVGPPFIAAIGWGDQVEVREALVGYEAREIAHIENLLIGESKVREHERKESKERTVETESEETTETEFDQQTSQRDELQIESSSAIEQEFAIKAGVNVSGRYGLTKIEASAEGSFSSNSTESRNSTSSFAREIVARAVEKTQSRTRTLSRVITRVDIREFNAHTFSNPAGDRQSISGIYRWVDKLHEVQLRHYGTRLMLEFHVPEPALGLLDAAEGSKRRLAPFELSPSDITEANYLCLTKTFGATDVTPPPAQYIEVGYGWASAPNEDDEAGEAQDTRADTIRIPPGYVPQSVTAIAHMLKMVGNNDPLGIFVDVGGIQVIHTAGAHPVETASFDPAFPWPSGVPVTLLAKGHLEKTATVQVVIRCLRGASAWHAWQLETWEKLRSAHRRLRDALAEEAEEAEEFGFSLEEEFTPRAEELRRTEREELKRWCIQSVRGRIFDFNAVARVGDHQEVLNDAAARDSAIVRLFEGAFEWDHMSYFLYPYYWGRREAWRFRRALDHGDAGHAAFLKAGAARVVVPVTPGFEERVLAYLDSDSANELAKIGAVDGDASHEDSPFEEFWLELLTVHHADAVRGSGTLRVRGGDTSASLNDDSSWRLESIDLGRTLHIAGRTYAVSSVTSPTEFELDRPFEGEDDDALSYAIDSVAYSEPWIAKVPTNLVVLDDNRDRLTT